MLALARGSVPASSLDTRIPPLRTPRQAAIQLTASSMSQSWGRGRSLFDRFKVLATASEDLDDCQCSESLACLLPVMRSDEVVPRRLPRRTLAAVLVLWYGGLMGLNAAFGDPGRVPFPGIAVFYGLWTLPGLAIPVRTAFRSGVLEALAVPLGTATGISAVAFASSGLLSCRPGARHEFGLVLVWATLACTAWSAGWISFRTNRPARHAGQVGLAFAALLGLVLFFGDHCDFGTAVDGGLLTFFWPASLMFTYPAALVGALVGALADAARRRRRSGSALPRPDR